MENFTPLSATLGGILIGLSSTLMLILHGRVTGISGIFGQAIARNMERGERLFRLWFLAGLIAGGAVLFSLMPAQFEVNIQRSTFAIAVAGVLVGVGTRLGSGCTSGHGVCGLSRFSPRSLLATLTFVATGALTVTLVRVLSGG
jgi:hypothetical protein